MPKQKLFEVLVVQTSETVYRVEAKDFDDAEYEAIYNPDGCDILGEHIAEREVTYIRELG